MIDTPGIRALNIELIPYQYLKDYFSEFDTYTCKYHNCYHDQDPGFRVKGAAKENSIFVSRYQSYLSMLKGYR
jgi:ribosome biogenesis GTPase